MVRVRLECKWFWASFFCLTAGVTTAIGSGGGTANVIQEHYRWRNDDGSQSTATWKANADTAITGVTRGSNIRLRFAVANNGTANSSSLLQLQFAPGTSGPWTPVSAVADGTSPFQMADSPGYSNNENVTAGLLAGSGAWGGGRMVDYPSNSVSGVSLTTNKYCNFEYCFRATAKVAGSSTYYFRLSNLNAYNQYAQLTMAAGEANEAPVLNGGGSTTAVVKAFFSYKSSASGSEPIVYGASNLPAGLSFDGVNTISGSPAGSGTFNISLSASNPFGSSSKTLTLTVPANNPPVAQNCSTSLMSGVRTFLSLPASDVDAGQTLTYECRSMPAHGTLIPLAASGSWSYTPVKDYAGPDSFTWRCNDGAGYSADATFSITVSPGVPVPQNQTSCAGSNAVALIPASYTGGGGYSYTLEIVTNAAHGNAEAATSSTFRYTPVPGYLGPDRFYWRMRYGSSASSMTSYTAIACCSITVMSASQDWPQWLCDEYRSSSTALELPSSLYLQWRRDYVPLNSVWTRSLYLRLGGSYQPVVMGQRMFVAACGAGGNDSLTALSTVNGSELWRFHADAPILLAPVAVNGRVYVSSDDGCLYCLDPATGSQLWKFRGAPSARKIFGNERLISAWPSRSGVLYSNGRIYFSAGLWPQEGTFVYCLDAATGSIIWKNDSSSGITANMQHDNATMVPAGITPQGYPAMGTNGSSLYLAVGRANPATFNRSTGMLLDYVQGDAAGYYQNINRGGGWWVNSSGVPSYYAPPVQVTAGSRTWVAGDASALGVSGTPSGMLAADDKLFVVTTSGSIYCFAGSSVANPPAYPVATTALANVNDSWTALATQILNTTSNREGCCLVAGLGTGRLAEELLRQTTLLHVIAIDTNAAKVAAFRAKMDAAGLYGTRCSAMVGSPVDLGLPPYAGRLIVSEDAATAGFAQGQGFVQSIFRTLRPYGGSMWLTTSAGEHSSLASWVSAGGLSNAILTRIDGLYSRLDRSGALPGAVDCLGDNGTSADLLVKAPLGMQWFGDKYTWGFGHGDSTRPDVVKGKMRGPSLTQDIYTGLPLSSEPRTGGGGVGSPDFGVRRNPFYGVDESRTIYSGYGCGSGMNSFGKSALSRSGSAGFYDMQTDIGTVHLTGVRPGCNGSEAMVPANGVLLVGGGGCNCNYPLTPSAFAMVSIPDSENWGMYSDERSTRSVESEPVHRLGINFGAPGERKDESGTMWIHRPQRQSTTPQFPVDCSGSNVSWYYHHASRIQNAADAPWVSASGVKGVTNISIGLAPESVVALSCAQPPVLDGNLSDSCWNGQYPVFMLGGNSQVFLRKDSSNLYVACRRTAPGGVSKSWVESFYKGWWRIFISDSVNGSARYLHLAVAADGQRKAALNTDFSWAGSWSDGFRGNTGTEFAVEFAVPLATITGAGLDTGKLVFDVCGTGYYAQQNTMFRQYQSDDTRVIHARWAPIAFDAPYGTQGLPRNYTVKLCFAETEGAGAGQRVFDVKLQGQTVLANFDIFAAAGGADRELVRTFQNIAGTDRLQIDFVARAGQPAISGIEIIEQSGGNNPPSVSITSPAAGAVYTAPATVTINANATDSDGTVSKVEFFNGSTKLGEDVSSPYSFTWSSVAAGTYTLTAKATDSSNAVAASAAVTITVNEAAVKPAITSPLNATGTVGSAFAYTVTASGTAPVTFGGSGLPAGLSLSGAVISGTPSAAGTNSVTLTASNAGGAVTNTLRLAVLGAALSDANNNGIPDVWEILNFGATNAANGSAQEDWDGDGMCNLAEYVAGTSPTNAASVLALSGASAQPGSYGLSFGTVTGRIYSVKWSDDPGSAVWGSLTGNVAGTGGQIQVTDTNKTGRRLYSIGTKLQ